MKTITIPLEQYECLRGCLNQAMDIFQSLGVTGGLTPAGNTSKRKTKSEKLAHYDKMIITGARGVKPTHLRK